MKIALVGNQNSGKTTLFNTLTGMNAKIGNWPGVTIEKKVGKIKKTEHEIVDLPGIYSLSPYSIEEEISRKFIFEEKPDVIINIVDSTALERSLYLTTQLLELDCKVIIALNMTDILEKKGITISEEKLEKELGTKVIKISALKEWGIKELLTEIEKKNKYNHIQIYDEKIENTIKKVKCLLTKEKINKRFVSVKLIERDDRFKYLNTPSINKSIQELSDDYEDDLEETIATQRYKFIAKVKRNSVIEKQVKETRTDKIDKILLNKWLGFPIFATVMFLIYYLSVGVIGSYTVDWVASIVEMFGETLEVFLSNIGASEWINSLVIDGIVSGVGAVLGFVPQLIILFICISVLETTGYMSRIALLFDKIFRKIGLSGKSLIPFIVGSGCSVPGIMGTRIIENQEQREMTTILTPFIPCSAKLPIIALFSGYFFGDYAGLASASLYFFAIIIIVLSAILMKKFVFKNTSSTYISELPEYKIPSIRYVAKDVFEKIIAFIKRAGSVILICSIVIWFLLSFSFNFEYGVEIEKSILASLGKTISWVFEPVLGENSWEATVSAIQGLVAKEQVISSMAVIAGLAEETEVASEVFEYGSIFSFFTASSAYSFMVFNLFSAPCFGAIGAMKRELGGNKKVVKAIIFQTVLAWLLATMTYQIGSRIEKGIITIADLLVIGAILIGVFTIIAENMKKRKSGEECSSCPYCRECNKK